MQTYFEIARAQAEAGDTTAAAKSLDAALKASRGLHSAMNPSQFTGRAAIVHATMGDYDRAFELVLSVDPRARTHFVIEIGKARAKAGHVVDAIDMAKQIGSPTDRAHYLIGVAKGLMDDE